MKIETKNRICSILERNEYTKTRVESYWYEILYNPKHDIVQMRPLKTGKELHSKIKKDSKAYRNGGEIFRAAVDFAKEIHEHLRKKGSIPDQSKATFSVQSMDSSD